MSGCVTGVISSHSWYYSNAQARLAAGSDCSQMNTYKQNPDLTHGTVFDDLFKTNILDQEKLSAQDLSFKENFKPRKVKPVENEASLVFLQKRY